MVAIYWSLVMARAVVNGYQKWDAVPTTWKGFWTDLVAMPPFVFAGAAFVVGFQVIISALFVTMFVGFPAVAGWRVFRGSSSIVPGIQHARSEEVSRYLLVSRIQEAIVACSDAYVAGGERKVHALLHVGETVQKVAHEVTVGRRAWGAVPTRSHRQRALKEHAGLVVAALHKAEARIDRDPDDALKNLARMMLTIAERYTAGKVGALLDEEELAGLVAVADRESWRIAGTALVVAGVGAGIALLDLPSTAETYLIGGAGAAIVALLYGRRAHRGLDVLDAVRGIQRP
ncbi:hypothetical protein ABZ621_14900 [Streptomyces sp. NPDC007863]|uniref:hypothetical protein n=1 Tax=Streptomyces sp. NPDC007863 TaxID=3154894 RepID=UPI003411BCF5